MHSNEQLTAELAQFSGSEHWFRHGLIDNVLFTEGAKFLADRTGSYWLLDEIALCQRYEERVRAEEFQLWKLSVNPDQTAILTCENGNGHYIFAKEIEFTDFPMAEIKLYCCDNTILLPSEY